MDIIYFQVMKRKKLTSSIVADGSVDINGEAGSQVGQETDGGQGNAVHVAKRERSVDDNSKDKDGDDGRLVSARNTVDHVGGSSSLARVGNFTDRCVTVTCVVLGDETDDKTSNGTHSDANDGGEGRQFQGSISHGRGEFKSGRQKVITGKVNSRYHDDCRRNELDLQGRFDLALGLDGENVGGNEGAEQAHKDTNGTDDNGETHGTPSSRDTDTAANYKSCAGRFGERSEKITSHTCEKKTIESSNEQVCTQRSPKVKVFTYQQHLRHCHQRYQRWWRGYEDRLRGYRGQLFRRDQLPHRPPWYKFLLQRDQTVQ